ncbi:MAG: hypothetical protein GYA12_13055 [Chloroflexi bacterium]|nr:hypothetical protein [Chloroflexota bacterium]
MKFTWLVKLEVQMKEYLKYILMAAVISVILLISGCGHVNAPPPKPVITEPAARPVVIVLTPFPTVTSIPTKIPVTVQVVPEEPTPPPHYVMPGEFSGKEQVIHDQVSENYAAQKRAYGGDEFYDGRFERPFDRDMGYLGYLDIVKATMTRTDPDFVYVTIQVAKPVSAAINNKAYYGLELDLNRDGRSLFMIRGLGPISETWSTEGVDVWKSTSAEQPYSMAGEGPIPVTGALGFDVNLLRAGRGSDNDLAWIRLKPGTEDTIEIAFKHSIVGGVKGKFIWRPFTDGAVFSEKVYDLHVSYTLEQAGSPLRGEPDYPLKEVFAVDNTCRVASGYEPTGHEPGICPVTLPEAPPDPSGSSPPCRNPNGGPC